MEPKLQSLQNIFSAGIRVAIAILAIWMGFATSLLAETFDVNNIRVAKNGQVTRVVFDTSATPAYKIFTLNNPARLVIDLDDAKLSTKVNQSVFNASFVNKLRHAKRANNKLRIVLDLNQQVVPKSFVLAPNGSAKHRLVVDLKNAGKGATQVAIAKPPITSKTKPTKTTNESKATPASTKVANKTTKSSSNKSTPVAKAAASKASGQQDIITKITTPKVAKPEPKKSPKLTSTKSKPANKTLIVAIDPGHGGKDPGAIGYAGTREKDVVLQISQRLKRLIDAERGMHAIMTRNSDRFLTLRGRIKQARQQKADIFISIHADAVDDRRARGSSVYVLSKNGASSEAARFLAKTQNESDVIGGVKLQGKGKDVQKVLVDLSQAATIDASMKLATSVKNELSRLGKTRKNVEHAGFAVLKSPDIPSILVETAFISNASEERKLRSATHQQKLAVSMFKGLKAYLKHHAPRDAIIANNTKPHTIKYGETLSEIAVRYSVSVDSIRKTNSLRTDRIRVGQKLIIPGV